jgi:hypothetical protein
VKLDIYEGVRRVFQVKAPQSPESVTSMKKMDAFLKQRLEK